ncbi:MAG: glycosyltransferase family 2 protein [Erysipelotrichia bacterium]|nr:glycosyltransferase family 2 protein [Erysipelotrichia bacterium]
MISIVVPVYNTEKYLSRCIESIVSQESFERQELILVDDGSTDNSGKICKEFEKKYDNVLYYRTDNYGVSHARNFGLKKSSHKYIMFVDSDDYLEQGTIDFSITNAVKDGVLIFNKVFLIGGNTVKNVLYKDNEIVRMGDEIRLFEYDMLTYSLDPLMNRVKWLSCGVTAKLFDSSIIRDVFFLENCKYGEDSLFNITAFHNSKVVKYVNYDGYIFNINDESSTGRYREDWVEMQKIFVSELTNIRTSLFANDVNFDKAYYFMVFTRFASMINKYFFNKQNTYSFDKNYNELISIMKESPYRESIKLVDKSFLNNKNKVIYYTIKTGTFRIFCALYWLVKKYGK